MKESPREGQSEEMSADGRDRTGTFTTDIVATGEDRKTALFFTCRDHFKTLKGAQVADLFMRLIHT